MICVILLKARPKDPFLKKYCNPKKIQGLELQQIKTYGRQILEVFFFCFLYHTLLSEGFCGGFFFNLVVFVLLVFMFFFFFLSTAMLLEKIDKLFVQARFFWQQTSKLNVN